jgi:hypothetical protein
MKRVYSAVRPGFLNKAVCASTLKSYNTFTFRVQEFRKGSFVTGNSAHIYVKGKVVSLQAWTGPEGSRRLRLPDFKTIGTQKW